MLAAQLLSIMMAKARKGFVLLPRRWVVERSFAWATRFRRRAKDSERLPETIARLHFLVVAIMMLKNDVASIARST
jgi:transposase